MVGVDYSAELIRQFEQKIERHASELQGRIRIVQQDVTQLSLERRDFPLGVLAFDSLLCLADFDEQCRALAAMSPFDEYHRQELRGWYDEIELMLSAAGLRVERIEGGHQGGPYGVESPRMFLYARKSAG